VHLIEIKQLKLIKFCDSKFYKLNKLKINMNFLKKVVENKIDENVHSQFIRFGKGEYKGRFPLNLMKSKRIKVKAGFEFANTIVALCTEFGPCKGSGIVLSKKDISKIMSEKNIKGNSETKKGGLYYQNNIETQEFTKEQLQELEKESYLTLLDLEGNEFKLKIKKKLPKPGKDEAKIDDKFCQLEVDAKYYSKIKEDLFWDVPEAKKIQIRHSIMIDSIIMPEGEKDFAKIRELSKRKGKIFRNMHVDGKEIVKEYNLEA